MLPTVALVVLLRKCQPDYLAQNVSIKRDSSWQKKYEVLAARTIKLITAARARKNKRTARMLTNARKDHSIPLAKDHLCACLKLNTAAQEIQQ